MKKLYLLIITAVFSFAGSFSPWLITDKSFELAGKFYYYPFYPKDDPKSAFNWVFETPTQNFYQLMGLEPSQNNVFGWKRIGSIKVDKPKWLFFYLGDVDGDGDSRFDWIVTPADSQKKIFYKLMEVTPQEHYFKYEGPYIFDFEFNGKRITFGKHYAKRVEVPFREHGYSKLATFIQIRNQYELENFLQEINEKDGWNHKERFVEGLRAVDLQHYNLILYRFSMPSGSIGVKVKNERFLAPGVLRVDIVTSRPEIGTADMAYYLLAYVVDKECERAIFAIDGKEQIFRLVRDYECSNVEAPVCGYRQIECITQPCPAMPVRQETFKNYCKLLQEGAIYVHDGSCDQSKEHNSTKLVRNLNHFGYVLASDIYGGSGNILISPYGIARVLEMAYAGSWGETKREFESYFGLDLEIFKGFKALAPKARSNELLLADSLWFERKLKLYESFVLKTEDFITDALFASDFFEDPEKERVRINEWVRKESRDKIKEFLPQGSITPDTRAVLLSVLYFKGGWASPFDPMNTKRERFMNEDGPIWVEMMSQVGRFKVMETPELKAIEIPYQDDELSMILFLPKGDRCVCDMLEYLKSHDLASVREEMEPKRVLLRMPKFRLSWGVKDLATNLQNIGFSTLFDPQKADLSRMAKPLKGNLYLKSLYHKALLEVDEEGSEGAAATGGVVSETAAPVVEPLYRFIVDRNFLFLIVDNTTGVVYFLGGIKRLPA
jgi:serpin B